jgi:hypothetical protein
VVRLLYVEDDPVQQQLVRARVERERDELKRRNEADPELPQLDRLAYRFVPLRVSHPEELRREAEAYGALLDLAARGSYDDLAVRMRSVAERIHELGARPRDCIEIHKEVLLRTSGAALALPEHAEHARMLLLDLVCARCTCDRASSLERGERIREQTAEIEQLRREARELGRKVVDLQEQPFELGALVDADLGKTHE